MPKPLWILLSLLFLGLVLAGCLSDPQPGPDPGAAADEDSGKGQGTDTDDDEEPANADVDGDADNEFGGNSDLLRASAPHAETGKAAVVGLSQWLDLGTPKLVKVINQTQYDVITARTSDDGAFGALIHAASGDHLALWASSSEDGTGAWVYGTSITVPENAWPLPDGDAGVDSIYAGITIEPNFLTGYTTISLVHDDLVTGVFGVAANRTHPFSDTKESSSTSQIEVSVRAERGDKIVFFLVDEENQQSSMPVLFDLPED